MTQTMGAIICLGSSMIYVQLLVLHLVLRMWSPEQGEEQERRPRSGKPGPRRPRGQEGTCDQAPSVRDGDLLFIPEPNVHLAALRA